MVAYESPSERTRIREQKKSIKSMKKTKFIAVAALAMVAALSSCQKESQVLRLDFEGPQGSNSKVVLGGSNGRTPLWETGDEVKINGQTFQLSASGQVEVESNPSGYIACFPAWRMQSSNAGNKTVSLEIPATQYYKVSNDMQKLEAPMVGYASQGDAAMTMKNVCAVAKVTFRAPENLSLRSIRIDDISAGSHTLSGTATVNLTSGTPVYGDPTNGKRFVELVDINKSMTAGQEESFYLYMAQGDAKLKYTIRYIDGSGKVRNYTRQKDVSVDMVRNHIGSLVVLDLSAWDLSVTNNVFTVDAEGTKVEFCPRNLAYYGNPTYLSTPSPQWFRYAWEPDGTIDKFGWNCWSQSSKSDIVKSSINNSDYIWGYPGTHHVLTSFDNVPGNARGYKKDAINNPAHWRLPTNPQWSFIFNRRTTGGTVDGTANALYARGVVGGANGLILFPDNYVHPTGLSCSFAGKINPGTGSTPSTSYNVTISDADWQRMETAGCVFLPAGGYRQGSTITGAGSEAFYWSSSCLNDTQACGLRFSATGLWPSHIINRYTGGMVRLVKKI